MITVSAVSAVLVIAVVITVIAVSVKNGRSAPAEAVISEPVYSDNTEPAADRPFLSEFIIYEDSLKDSFAGVKFSRQDKEPWSEEDINRYWIEPEKIAEEHLNRDAAKIVRDIFADVP